MHSCTPTSKSWCRFESQCQRWSSIFKSCIFKYICHEIDAQCVSWFQQIPLHLGVLSPLPIHLSHRFPQRILHISYMCFFTVRVLIHWISSVRPFSADFIDMVQHYLWSVCMIVLLFNATLLILTHDLNIPQIIKINRWRFNKISRRHRKTQLTLLQ